MSATLVAVLVALVLGLLVVCIAVDRLRVRVASLEEDVAELLARDE